MAQIQARPGTVYVLKQAASHFYKVGLTSGNVADRIKQLQTGNPKKISQVFSQKVTDVGQAEKAAKDSVKKFHAHPEHQGGTEWYEVPSNKYSGFIKTIESAINRYRSKISNRMTLQSLQQAIAQMLNKE